jgi:hypothetical protein
MLACMECTPVAIRSIHVLSNLGGDRGATLFSGGGAIATSRHPLAPPLLWCIDNSGIAAGLIVPEQPYL